MSKKLQIVGNFNIPQSDFNQTDTTKSDYIKNKPTLGAIASKNEIAKTDLAEDVQESINTIANKADSSHDHLAIHYTKTEVDNLELITTDDIDAICVTTTGVVGAEKVSF